jgi:hypothetical protein
MLRTLAFTAVLLGAQAAAHADVYRWVDARGQVQYSDRWVPGSELVKVDKGKQDPEATAARQASDQSKLAASKTAVANQQAQAATVQTVQKDVAKARAEQCKQATERYDKAVVARRIFKTDKDGKREYVSDAEADAYRTQALTDKQTACGPLAK